MLNLTESLSDVSRTNQVKILMPPEDVAEKLFQYLYKAGKGIEHFSIREWYTKEDYPKSDKRAADAFFKTRDKNIRLEIQKRLSEYGEEQELSNIQYFLS